MTIPTHPRDRDGGTPFVCQQCRGPCRTWKGTTHQWTCEECLRAYIDGQPDHHRRRSRQTDHDHADRS